MTAIREEFYHGWTIQVAQKSVGYTFECRILEQQVDVSHTQYYSTCEQALYAGRLWADLESVRLSLTAFLRGKLQLLLLSSDERSALENSIVQYIDAVKSQSC